MDCSLLPGGPQRHFVRCRPKSEARPLCLCCLLTSPPLPASPTFTSETQASLETACLGMSPASATTSQGPGQSDQPTRHSRGRELCVSANNSVPSQAWHKTLIQQGLISATGSPASSKHLKATRSVTQLPQLRLSPRRVPASRPGTELAWGLHSLAPEDREKAGQAPHSA